MQIVKIWLKSNDTTMSNQTHNPASLFRISGAVVKSAQLPISDVPRTVQDSFNSPCCLMHPYKKATSDFRSEGTHVAADAGHNDCIDYALEHGYTWDSITTEMAAKKGHLSTLAHAHRNGCPMTSTCIDAAMEGGHLQCVKYATQNGCNWSEDSLIMAIKTNQVECFKYGYDNGAPYDEVVMYMLSPGFEDEIIDFLYTKGHNHPGVDRSRSGRRLREPKHYQPTQ